VNAPPAALLDSRYRLGSVIARGGMSTVYRGVDTRLDRPVAIKIMDAPLAGDPTFRARFEREARSAARIDHPAVVDVHDQGESRGIDGPVTFLVMELVEGGTLRDVLRSRGAIGVPAAVAVLEPVLEGLAEAHRLGLVHRDVKPENVLISGHGEVKVADFGLVTAAATAGVSHAGMILGTVAYLSPEQVATGAADARSDVYAAGVLLYELLVGEPPYTGDTAISVAYRHVNCDVPPPSAMAGDVPPELDELVARATRRDPAGRPADAAALLSELRRVARQLEIPAVDVPVPPPQADQPTAPTGGLPRSGPGLSAPGLPTAAALVPGTPGAGMAGPGMAGAGMNGAGMAGAGMNGVRAAGAAAAGCGRPGPVGPGGTRTLPRPAEPPTPPPERAPHLQARRRSRRIFATWVALVVAFALLVGTAAWWLGSGRWTAMPEVLGLPEATAQQLLAEADLVVTTTRGGDGRAAAGVVIDSDQAPGARLLRGSQVALTVSAGGPRVPAIPVGTPRDDAEQLIRDAGLDPDVDRGDAEYSDEPEGTVIGTTPPAGTQLQRGATVRLVLSRGPEESDQVRVPNVVGDDVEDARAELTELGLEVDQESRSDLGERFRDRFGDRFRNPVVEQSQGPDSLVDRGTTITLTTAF
jgi:eukaryotic-like serine/threonine-protein kinase